MKRINYLSDGDVDAFTSWLGRMLSEKTPPHSYITALGVHYHFSGLSSALVQYDWKFSFSPPGASAIDGHTYADNEAALSTLRGGLATAIGAPGAVGEDAAVRDWAKSVMQWGGVTNGNARWLNANVAGLADEIRRGVSLLSANDDAIPALAADIGRFNAGMTKVYSLLVPDFIIYDSRVAGALAWFVALWYQQNHTPLVQVPALLRFPCMRPKEAADARTRKLRNPSCGVCEFNWLYSAATPAVHAHWNLRASWILAEALVRATKLAAKPLATAFHTQADPLRALEAALFMWGYDLSASSPCLTGYEARGEVPADQRQPQVDTHPRGVDEPPNAHSGITRGGKAKEFSWWFDSQSDSLVIKRKGNEVSDSFSCGELFRIIYELYDQFGYDWFRLGNDMVKMAADKEQFGLGMAIVSASRGLSTFQAPSPQCCSHAQTASQLGVILQQIGLAEGDGALWRIQWRLLSELPENMDELRMLLNAP